MFDWLNENNWAILLIIIVIAVCIGAIAYLIHRYINKNKKEEKPSDEEIAKETMDRFLVDVDDEKQKAEFDKYQKEHDDKDKQKENK